MVQELHALLSKGALPWDAGSIALIVATCGALAGFVLWLAGAKFSRPLITLLTVLAGGAVGMQLPHWFGWSVSGAGPAVGGAVVLGVSGYVLHRFWVGLGLGLVLACWTALACWILLRHGQPWLWPTATPQTTVLDYFRAIWQTLPRDVANVLPYTCGAALLSGVAASIIWDRPLVAVAWSTIGITMFTVLGIAAMEFGRPDLIKLLPSRSWAQVSTLVVLTAAGSLIQLRLAMPGGANPPVAPPAKEGPEKKPKGGAKKE